MFHILVTVYPSVSFNFFFDVIQIRRGVNVFEDYFKTSLLLRFICVEFRVLAF